MTNCKTCKRPLNDGTAASTDCGGDCLTCMARFGDPDAVIALYDAAVKGVIDTEDRMAALALRHGLKSPPMRARRTLRMYWAGRHNLGLGPAALLRAWRVAGVPSPEEWRAAHDSRVVSS